jgi:glutamate synthase (NADPH) large chain
MNMKTSSVAAQPMNRFSNAVKANMPDTDIIGTGMISLPQYEYEAVLCMEVLTRFIRQEGLELIEYHELAVGNHLAQVFIKANMKKKAFEQKLSLVRNLAQEQIHQSKLKHRDAFSIGRLSAQIIRKAS